MIKVINFCILTFIKPNLITDIGNLTIAVNYQMMRKVIN